MFRKNCVVGMMLILTTTAILVIFAFLPNRGTGHAKPAFPDSHVAVTNVAPKAMKSDVVEQLNPETTGKTVVTCGDSSTALAPSTNSALYSGLSDEEDRILHSWPCAHSHFEQGQDEERILAEEAAKVGGICIRHRLPREEVVKRIGR